MLQLLLQWLLLLLLSGLPSSVYVQKETYKQRGKSLRFQQAKLNFCSRINLGALQNSPSIWVYLPCMVGPHSIVYSCAGIAFANKIACRGMAIALGDYLTMRCSVQ